MSTVELSGKDAAIWQEILRGRERDKVHHHARKEQIRVYDQQYRARPGRAERDKDIHAERYANNRFVGMEKVVSLLSSVEPLTGEFAEWLAGFFEGDGSFHFYGGAVDFAQKDAQILEYIQDVIGDGTLSWNGQYWVLFLYKESAARFVKTLMEYVSCSHRLEQLRSFCKAELHSPTKYWFTGFWDAEGSSSLTMSPSLALHVGVTQKDINVLEALQILWNSGRVYERQGGVGELRFNSAESVGVVGRWLLATSRNDSKRNKLHQEMCVWQELRKRR